MKKSRPFSIENGRLFGGFAPVGVELGARWGCRSCRTFVITCWKADNTLEINEKAKGQKKGLAMFYGTLVHFRNAIAGLKKKKELRTAQLL